MPLCSGSVRKCKEPSEKLVSPKGGRLGRIEKVVMMSIWDEQYWFGHLVLKKDDAELTSLSTDE
jgi:hypothetical protein